MSSNADIIEADVRTEGFAFVRSLANELSAGRVDLPSFPEIALKMRQALEDPAVTIAQIARIVRAEAALAARILVMANSAALGHADKPVVDLKAAVTRIGLSNVRTAVLAFSLHQLRQATQFKAIIPDLKRLWNDSTQAAALSRVLAGRMQGVDPDLAMLAGLLHNIGSVYILARSQSQPGLNSNSTFRELLLREWSPSIGRSIAENWGLPEEVVEAIGQQADVENARRGAVDLADVLQAVLWAVEEPSAAVLGRLSLTQAGWTEIVEASQADIDEIKAALNG